MRASECRTGKKLRHKELKTIIEVKEIDGSKVWEDTQWGDIFDWVDGKSTRFFLELENTGN